LTEDERRLQYGVPVTASRIDANGRKNADPAP
jgi:hypothetical protein